MPERLAALAEGTSVALVVAGSGGAGLIFITGHVEHQPGRVCLRMPGDARIALRPEWSPRLVRVEDLLAVAVLHGALWMLLLAPEEFEACPELAALRLLATPWPGAA
jgi:hypothetical protein